MLEDLKIMNSPKSHDARLWCVLDDYEIAWLGWTHQQSFKDNVKKLPRKYKCLKCKRKFKPRIKFCEDEGCAHAYLRAHKK